MVKDVIYQTSHCLREVRVVMAKLKLLLLPLFLASFTLWTWQVQSVLVRPAIEGKGSKVNMS